VPRLTQVTLTTRGVRVQVRLQATGPARVRHGYLPGPEPRYYIDVEGALPDLPEQPPAPPEGCVARSIRVGRFSTTPPVSRIVLDLEPGTTAEQVAPPGASS
jgi:hypothetical protein